MNALLLLLAASVVPPPHTAASESTVVIIAPIPHYEPQLRLTAPLLAPAEQRPRAVQLSDGYYTRLKIHRYTSFAMVPVFVAQYSIGRRLYNQTGENESLQGPHSLMAGALYSMFAVNSVTGAWNLWETRAQREGRTRRVLHSAMMLAAGAGFIATSMLAPDDDETAVDSGRRRAHRTVAIASMSTALVGNIMMLIWNKR